MKLDAYCRSHTGKIRNNNEDNFYLCGKYRKDLNDGDASCHKKLAPKACLFAVADGMGGALYGEEASLIAVKSLVPCTFDELEACALRSVSNANLHICAEIEKRGGGRMGSTLVALYVDDGKAVCCNVGDSRAYLFRKGELHQLSVDDSRTAQMISLGVITPEQARKHPARHEILQHLGIFEDEMIIEPHFSQAENLQSGDVFLLCSDGLTDMVDDPTIKEIIKCGDDSKNITERLITAALENGGADNVTVMVVAVI